MAIFMASAGFLLLLVLSQYGWGYFILHQIMPNNSFGWAYRVTFGMAFWLFLGAILNHLSLAKPTILWGILFIGTVLSTYILKKPATRFIKNSLVSLIAIGQLAKKLKNPLAMREGQYCRNNWDTFKLSTRLR
ncbi:MAG: hypothetical protein HQL69_14135 [Magnetococcales bacterium]|nr:hypothetical protein [Magnetococcales bacterium]